mgnify:CR=1 FL=1
MSRKHDPAKTLERLRAILRYDPLTGNFHRKDTGAIVGHEGERGYIVVCLGNDTFKSHHLAWLWCYGQWPEKQIDHINRIKTDNRIANLRDVTNRENSQNKSTNTSGYVGVSWSKQKSKWQARIEVDGKSRHLGFFDDPRDASNAYQMALNTLKEQTA